eukprot:TRINITY_DN22649_c0_g1_i1.p1 TRINITY_DN22649_c0_g1~~TRINITY_DN22649_c0_g1_i1.p1  ORF type:complete len:469 (-),score=50.48 TRINITY_DN22649_c0_g1_i1:253-1659(-)
MGKRKGVEYNVYSLCGDWRDGQGSKYFVDVGKEGKLNVCTIRPNGRTIKTSNLIRLDDQTGWIVWGRSNVKSLFWLEELSESSLTWAREGKKSFIWERCKSWDCDDEAKHKLELRQARSDVASSRAPVHKAAHQVRVHVHEHVLSELENSDDHKNEYALASVRGTWTDSKKCTYSIDAARDGCCNVLITRRGGNTIQYRKYISLDKKSGWIVYGRAEPKYWLVDIGPTYLEWDCDTSKPFKWWREHQDRHESVQEKQDEHDDMITSEMDECSTFGPPDPKESEQDQNYDVISSEADQSCAIAALDKMESEQGEQDDVVTSKVDETCTTAPLSTEESSTDTCDQVDEVRREPTPLARNNSACFKRKPRVRKTTEDCALAEERLLEALRQGGADVLPTVPCGDRQSSTVACFTLGLRPTELAPACAGVAEPAVQSSLRCTIGDFAPFLEKPYFATERMYDSLPWIACPWP